MNFSEYIALQPQAWSALARAVLSERVASTYLMTGPEGLGHWPLSLAFAALLNCAERITTGDERGLVPCGECVSCRGIANLNFGGLYLLPPIPSHANRSEAIDLINYFLDEKRKEPLRIVTFPNAAFIPIDMAREVKRSLSNKGDAGVRRVVLFYQMDRMMPAAADSLLKLIEEPPADTVIILTASRTEYLLPTINSRSRKVRLGRVNDSAIATYLQSKYEIEERRGRLLGHLAGGNPGEALALIGKEEEGEESRRAVGFVLFRSVVAEPAPATISHILEMVRSNDRAEVDALLRLWQSCIRDCVYLANTEDRDGVVNLDLAPELVRLAPLFARPGVAHAACEAIKNSLADLRRNVHIHPAIVALSLEIKQLTQSAGEASLARP